jgi:apolipoprotein N-acyltransferase
VSEPRLSNAAVSVDDAGRVTGQYRKNLLAPIGERVPAALHALFPRVPVFSAGTGAGNLSLDGTPIAVAICYEDLFPSYVANAVTARHAQLLVDLSNDGWFLHTQQPELHAIMSRMRAIENRRYMVRAATTGRSMVLDATGRVIAQAPLGRIATLSATVASLDTKTSYQRVGQAPWYAIVGGAALLAMRRSKRRGVSPRKRQRATRAIQRQGGGLPVMRTPPPPSPATVRPR